MHTVSAATTYAPRNTLDGRLDSGAEHLVRHAVRELLDRSPAFQALGADPREAIAAGMVSVGAYMAGTTAFARLLQAVDFPAFVGGLINGVFNAAVAASVEQMEVYGDLLKAVTDSIDHFVKNNATDAQARDYLIRHYPDLVPEEKDNADTTEALCHRPLIASMRAVGIGKITSTA